MQFERLGVRWALAFAACAALVGSADAQCNAADTFEDDDDCANASVITAGTQTGLTCQGPGSPGGDDRDFFRVTVPAGEILTVEVIHEWSELGDLDAYLYDAASPTCGDKATFLDDGFTSSNNESMSYENTTGSSFDVIIEVSAWTGGVTDVDCNTYDLVVQMGPDPCATPIDDGFEENDACGSGSTLGMGLQHGLLATDVDADYYEITVPAAEILTIDVLYADVLNADVDLTLYDDTVCTNQLDSDLGFEGGATVTWTNATGSAATVTLLAEIDAGTGTCNEYALNVATVPDICQIGSDDSFEENDDCASAVALPSGSTTGLFATDLDDDYYTISVPAGEIATIDVAYTGATPVDLELFDDLACTNEVDSVFSSGGSGQVSWGNSTGATTTFVLRALIPFAGECNAYDLNVTVVPDPCVDPLADDSFEDNDTCATAVPMADGLTTGLFVSKADEDFYSVTVGDGDMLVVDVFNEVANGDVDLYLYDDTPGACGDIVSGWIDRGFTSTDNEQVDTMNSSGSTQTYYIQVVIWASDDQDCNDDYDLQITGSGGAVATPFCHGDGTADVGGGPVACPCGNESSLGAGEGCESSLGMGAVLTATGSNVVANDDLGFTITQARPNQPSLLIQGVNQVAFPFKDGILCMGTPTERIEVVFLDAAGEGSTTSSIVTEGNVTPGDTRYYQQWYRDPGGVSPCGTGSNFTHGQIVNWI